MILIGSMAVPSYWPGMGNEVTIKIRMSSGSILVQPKTIWNWRCRPWLGLTVPGMRFSGSGLRIWAGVLRRMDHHNRLATMALGVCQGASHAAVEGLDRGIKDAACGVDMTRAHGVGITWEASTRPRQTAGPGCSLQARRDLVRLK